MKIVDVFKIFRCDPESIPTKILTVNYHLLLKVLSLPTAPFRESHVINEITKYLSSKKIPFFRDGVGNIVIGASSREDYRALLSHPSKEPLRCFMAHMDHPGFHGVAWKGDTCLKVKWFGGSPTRRLLGARVWLADGRERVDVKATLHRVKMNSARSAIESGEVLFQKKGKKEKLAAKSLFGGFSFRSPVWKQGDLYYTHAADDLVGAVVGVSVYENLYRKGNLKNVVVLLTRAEEVGFIGALSHFHEGWFRNATRRILCVSLETSRTLPGAKIGGGPVVRLGDRATTFDPASLELFTQLARKVLPGRHQRRIMDGGTCEGTVSTAFGVATVGISIPLGNYHNQSFEGGPDSRGEKGPAPEFVHRKDVMGMFKLCLALSKNGLPWATPFATRQKDLEVLRRKFFPLLMREF